jgi:carbon starvation protein
MTVTWIILFSLLCFFLAYRFYSRHLSKYIFDSEDNGFTTPAHELRDDVDFVPAKKHVLFGHHFSSIAGAAPILGPAIAIMWGWLPAILWVVFGTVFMGAVHDFGSLVMSVKHKGASVGAITQKIIGTRSKILFLTIIFLLVFIVIAVFAFVIANLFVQYPGSVIPINFEILVAIIIGKWAYKKERNLLIPSIIALILLYVTVYIGFLYPVVLPEWMCIEGSQVMTWIVFLMVYGFVAAVLPVWTLLQPRDFINSHQLVVGLIVIYLGIFITQPEMDAPALNLKNAEVNWFPFLFITIACGAISGFHALVASGTTSKQLNKLSDARPIGYGAMLGEASLALAATIAVAAGFENAEAWHVHYHSYAEASTMGAKLGAFVDGTSSFLEVLGLNVMMENDQGLTQTLSAVFISVLVISFAATSLDTAVRIQRYILGEIGEVVRVKSLRDNRYVQSGLAVGFSFLLVLSGEGGKGGLALWPLFGSTNQLLGSLTLLVLSVWLFQSKKNYWWTLAPMIFVTLMTFVATVFNMMHYFTDGSHLLFLIAFLIAVCQIWIIIEGISAFRRKRSDSVS